jgi:hypothetical protein
LPDPGTPSAYASKKGQTIEFMVTGNTMGRVYGTERYTLDSRLCAVAVHAGVLNAGETGVVKVTILPGLRNYTGSIQNGVTSKNFPFSEYSYTVEKGSNPSGHREGVSLAPESMLAFKEKIGDVFVYEVTGSTKGLVYGTDYFTLDSNIATAAVHSGVLDPGMTAKVKITTLPAREFYKGSTRNGVTSHDFGRYGGSYRIERYR